MKAYNRAARIQNPRGLRKRLVRKRMNSRAAATKQMRGLLSPGRLAKRRSLSKTLVQEGREKMSSPEGAERRSGRFRVGLHALSARKKQIG